MSGDRVGGEGASAGGMKHGAVAPRRAALKLALALLLLATAAMLADLAFPLPLPRDRDGGTIVLAADGTPLLAFSDVGGFWI